MELLKSFFNTLGTEVINAIMGLIVGAVTGGAVGYKVGISRNTLSQKQDARGSARQEQVGHSISGEMDSSRDIKVSTSKMKQVQKAGDNAIQTQIGGINHDRR